MRLVATLIDDRAAAMQILREAPNNSLILFPETVSFLSTILKPYSFEKNLFIIFNSDVVIDGKTYIAIRAMDKGEYQWTVRKFKPWHTDIKYGISASKPNRLSIFETIKLAYLSAMMQLKYSKCMIC